MKALAMLICAFTSGAVLAAASAPAPAAMGPGAGMPPGVAAGVAAPDGIGVTVERSPSAGAMEQGPWVPGSTGTALQAGALMPSGSIVRTLDNRAFDLNAAVSRKPTILIFYRGGWCPYCNAHLRELQKSMPTLKAMGYQLLAISTDTPAALRKTLTDNALDYQLYSDSKLEVATRFGLKYKVLQQYLDHVKNDKGTDLVAQNGGYLINPGAFIVDRSGVIRFAYVNSNFSVRISQDALLAAARTALEPAAETSTQPKLTDLTGKAFSLGNYRGRMVLLNLWATWCVPCLKEMPEIDRFARQADAKKLAVVGVAADELAEAQAFVKKLGVSYSIGVGDPDAVFAWSETLGNVTAGLPFSVILDVKGKVVWKKSGGNLTADELSAAFKKLP